MHPSWATLSRAGAEQRLRRSAAWPVDTGREQRGCSEQQPLSGDAPTLVGNVRLPLSIVHTIISAVPREKNVFCLLSHARPAVGVGGLFSVFTLSYFGFGDFCVFWIDVFLFDVSFPSPI